MVKSLQDKPKILRKIRKLFRKESKNFGKKEKSIIYFLVE